MKKTLFTFLLLFIALNCLAQMSGTYTIDPSGSGTSNFKTFTAAVDTLKSLGVSGPVVFNIADGEYKEQVSIPEISGASATNRITFQSKSGDSSKVLLWYNQSTTANSFALQLDGADYITFKQMGFKRTSSLGINNNYAIVIKLLNRSCHNSFLNNYIGGLGAGGSISERCLIFSDTSANNYNRFISNKLVNGAAGFYFHGNPSSNLNEGLYIEYNDVQGVDNPVDITYQTSPIIKNNNFAGAASNGIYLAYCYNDIRINNNFIRTYNGNCLSLLWCSDTANGLSPHIFNNILLNHSSTNAYGIAITNSKNLNIVHNSVHLTSLWDFTSYGSACNISGGSNINLYNNIFAMSCLKKYVISASPGSIGKSDYNNFFTEGETLAYYGGDITTLTDWLNSTGLDKNSISVNPFFMGNVDLTPRALGLDGKAIFMDSIAIDFYGNNRYSGSADMGAIEFAPLENDLSVKKIIAPDFHSCGDSSTKISISVYNGGSKAQSNFDIYLELKGTSQMSVSEKYTGTLLPEKTDTFYFKSTFNTYSGGSWVISAYTDLNNDGFKANDTATKEYNVGGFRTLSVLSDSICHKGKLSLSATTGKKDPVFWYKDSTGAIPIDTTSNFTTPVLNDSETYYARTETYNAYSFVRPLPNNPTSLPAGLFSRVMYIDIYDTMVIDSIGVYTTSNAGDFELLLETPPGSVIQSAFISLKGNTTIQYVKTNFIVYPGRYGLRPGSKSTADLVAEVGTSGGYPKTAPGFMSVVGNSFIPGNYYYFYDFRFHTASCPSPRIPVHAIVKHTENVAFTKALPFEGSYYAGSAANPDLVCANSTVSYAVVPPNIYKTEDYNKTWLIDSFSVITSTGLVCTDTFLTMPDTGSNWQIHIKPGKKFADSLLKIYVRVQDLVQGCDTSIERYVEVQPLPEVDFDFVAGCDGWAVNFTDSSKTGGVSPLYYLWDFGDGGTSTSKDNSHKYDSAGTYIVSLRLTYPSGCADSVKKAVTVDPVPRPDFYFVSACAGQQVKFYDSSYISSGKITYHWNFGDGGISKDQNPTHIYAQPGTYLGQLLVTSDKGCTNIKNKQITVYSVPKPDFTAQDVCVDNTVSFSNLSTPTDSLTYLWQFGDGSVSADKEPVKKYDSAGIYNVSLLLTTPFGCSDSIVKQVNIYAVPEAAFSASTVCEGDGVIFTNLSTIESSDRLSYEWDFGDGQNSSLDAPVHTYANMGYYEVSLKVVSSKGCENIYKDSILIHHPAVADFTSPEFACPGEAITFNNTSYHDAGDSMKYFWDFGDGGVSNDKNPSHSFQGSDRDSFVVKLTVVTSAGCNTPVSQTISILEPQAAFMLTPPSCRDAVQFIDKSTVRAGKIVSWLWDFGDGQTDTSESPVHPYASGGTYNVRLTITTDKACSATISAQHVIYDIPKADFLAENICAGDTLFLFSLNTGMVKSQQWYIDGHLQSSAPDFFLTLDSPGSYHVKFVIASPNGCKDSISKTIEVYPYSSANFQWVQKPAGEFEFIADDKTAAVYEWDFGDGEIQIGTFTLPHIYAQAGKYQVSLKVINQEGCESVFSDSVEYYKDTVATPCEPGVVNEWLVYPNPVLAGHFSVRSPDCIVINQINVFDLTGRRIVSESVNSDKLVKIILPDNASPGIYNILILPLEGKAIARSIIIK